jgi:hypothetical protein
MRFADKDYSSAISSLLDKFGFHRLDASFQFLVFQSFLRKLDDALSRSDAYVFMFVVQVLHEGFGCLGDVGLD